MTSDPNPMLGHTAETTVVAAAVLLPAFWEQVERLPEFEDFENSQIGALWAATLAARKRGKINRAAVAMQLREMGYDEATCFTALSHVRQEFLTVGDAITCAHFLLDRRLKLNATRLLTESLNGLATASAPQELLERHERAVSDLVMNHAEANGFKASFACDVSKTIFRGAATGRRIPTGWADVDEKVRGWPRGKTTLIAARPSMGKSAFAVCAAQNLAEQGRGVGFVSMEMNEIEIWTRLAASLCYRANGANGPEYEAVMNAKAPPHHVRMMEDAIEQARELPMALNDRSRLKVSEIHRWARRLDREYRNGGRKLDVLIIDYLQLARIENNRNGNKVQEVSDVSADLMALAKDLDVALIALSQLSRAPEQRGNPRPQLSDLRDSGSLEQDADMVGMLFRPAYYLERKAKEEDLSPKELAEVRTKKFVLEIDFQKNRNGKTGPVDLYCDIGRNAVRNLAPAYRSVAA